jgi:DNA primase small subunit
VAPPAEPPKTAGAPDEGPSPSDLWLAGRFGEYYRRHPPEAPDRFGRREYGYLFFGRKFMMRHVGFRTRSEFEQFHARRAPAHSYYSTAYYDKPDAPTMKEKGWKAAELIFDLDADHVPGAEKLGYAQQLDRVKEHFVRLVDDFILRDFGFEEKDLMLTFSGGRGYHCHVLAEKALQLTSRERAEIVDYITGTGLEVGNFLVETTKARPARGQYVALKRTLKVASAGSPGWGGRLNRALETYVGRLKALPGDQRVEEFRKIKGIGEKGLVHLLEELERLDAGRMERMREGFADQGELIKRLIPVVVKEQIIPLAKGETDEPVTSDVKRLIRTPGSLHGKSGLRVIPLTRGELDGFDPLVDAVVFTDDSVDVEVVKPVEVPLKRQGLKLSPGRQKVPEWAAVFAMMRGSARPAEAD